MTQAVETGFNIKDQVLSNASFGPQEVRQMIEAIARDHTQYAALRDAAAELEVNPDRSPAAAVRLGVCYYLLGRYRQTAETLGKADGGALAHYYLGKSLMAQENYAQAIESFQAAKKAGYSKDEIAVAIAEAQRLSGDPQASLKTLDGLSGAIEQTADYLYQRGATVAALGGARDEIIGLYRRAVSVDSGHAGALFGLALENDRYGNDEEALSLYRRAAETYPTFIGPLLNLGVLHEDRGEFTQAQQCYHRILELFPNHPRAKLYAKDAHASTDTAFDEETQRHHDRLTQILSQPVTDFELSVRSRNCLQKMGIRTLGDLTRTTEQELLASKNFGETSLEEIREMLASKGLGLGQFAHERTEPEPHYEAENLSPEQQRQLDRPLTDLNLSVRARKAMVRLGLNTIGELVRKSGDDLLECKNFGVTSLNEVREKLTGLGIKLRND